MNENTRSSRATRVGSSNERIDVERNSKTSSKNSVAHNSIGKRNSWTSLVTKARRSSKKRKTSLFNSTKVKKEIENNVPKTNQSYGRKLEDYTSWCNHYLLRGLHREISSDLRTAVGDGVTLINLVESLTTKTVRGAERQPTTWSQKLENVHLCFGFLVSEGVRLSGISPEDIIEGQLSAILNLFQRLETHFEYPRYPDEKGINKNRSSSLAAVHGLKNGRISSGYHTEDDGYIAGRTTPTIDALPGLLVASDSNSESGDDTAVDPTDIRLHQHDRKEKTRRHQDDFQTVSCNINNATTKFHNRCLDGSHNSRGAGTLDNIGYMPSHPSTKARTSVDKTEYGEHDDSMSLENDTSNQRTVIPTSHLKMATPERAVLLDREDDYGSENFGMEFTASDFGIDESTSAERGSISSTGTPDLPDLSSTSSFEDPPLDFSSDASGFARENFASSTKLYQDSFDAGRPNNVVDIQKQVESLHSMYQKLLVLVDKDSQDVKRKTKWNLVPKMAAIQAKSRSTSKQRTKDMKSVSRRFNRIESNIVTLARSVDHLRSETRSQADATRQVDELKADISEFKDSVYSNSFHTRHSDRSRDYKLRLHRLQKLKSFFGEEPPMVSILLQRMGYERFIPHFKAEEIGILELPYVTEQRLQNLGIPLGPRLRILEEIQQLQ